MCVYEIGCAVHMGSFGPCVCMHLNLHQSCSDSISTYAQHTQMLSDYMLLVCLCVCVCVCVYPRDLPDCCISRVSPSAKTSPIGVHPELGYLLQQVVTLLCNSGINVALYNELVLIDLFFWNCNSVYIVMCNR